MKPTDEPIILRFPGLDLKASQYLLTETEEKILRILEMDHPPITKVFHLSKLVSDAAMRASLATAREINEDSTER